MSVLVTGAAGFAGGHLLDLLSQHGAEITAWHRPGTAPPRQIEGTTWDAVDLLDRRSKAMSRRSQQLEKAESSSDVEAEAEADAIARITHRRQR